MYSEREKEILKAISERNLSLAGCLWNSWREKSFASTLESNPDPFQPIYDKAKEMMNEQSKEIQ